ncbi:hypothetical protein TCAL_15941 [Tigriopus californicus]|uniref:Uncharacterized protein n=1 Tax=Tigriopus californicus TaxID=6832 RepID=A0A553PFG6_TIGCA|nr:hypothetical protein TCAL_15941 [Tigriopus californicus]
MKSMLRVHFKVTTSDLGRKNRPTISNELTRGYLTPEDVPSVFANFEYAKVLVDDQQTDTKDSNKCDYNLQAAEDNFFKQQQVFTLNDIKQKVPTINPPPEVEMQTKQSSLVLAWIILNNSFVPYVEHDAESPNHQTAVIESLGQCWLANSYQYLSRNENQEP